MANPFCHIELQSSNTDASKKFYGELFGWELEDIPIGDSIYTNLHDDQSWRRDGRWYYPQYGSRGDTAPLARLCAG